MKRFLALAMVMATIFSFVACGKDENAQKDCSSCSKSISKDAAFCEYCGVAVKTTENYFTYTVSNGTATITNFNRNYQGDIIIPETLGGYPVASIGYGAFRYCDRLTSVTLPDSVTNIDTMAFSNCESLTSVAIGNSVTSIGNDAFYGCKSLTSVTIPNSVTSIGRLAFSHCESLTSVTIGNGVTCIREWTFNGCNNLTSVVIGNSVTSIGNHAFYGCMSLTSVTIPDSVTDIGENAFSGCKSLTTVYFSSRSQRLKLSRYFDYNLEFVIQ